MTLAWARMTPKLIDELQAMPPREAALALRDALENHAAVARCTACEIRYDVHGDVTNVTASPCPVCGETLELEPPLTAPDRP